MRAERLLMPALLLAAAGCAMRQSPRGYRADAETMQVDARGGWLNVTLARKYDGWPRRLAGELLAVDADSLHLLTADHRMISLSWSQVRAARLEAWKSDAARLAGPSMVGLPLSVGHGWFGLISLPIWSLTSTGVVAGLSWKPVLHVPPDKVEELPPFARFPGGLPRGLDRHSLRMLPAPLPLPAP